MHDLLEETVPVMLKHVFNCCIKDKILTLIELEHLIESFSYGKLYKKNEPEKLNMDKKNLGQSATQMYCLILNIPFILLPYKEKLRGIWKVVETMLQILEIVFSESISEKDIEDLKKAVETHLKLMIDIFGVSLIPKYHLLLHYPRVIRAMGPLIFMWNMRFEAKHQFFKAMAVKTQNYVNLNKPLAEKCQLLLALQKNSYTDDVARGKVICKFNEIDNFDQFEYFHLPDNTLLIDSLNLNCYYYKSGLLLIFDSKFYEIAHILNESDNFSFICEVAYNIVRFDTFLNSLVLEKVEINPRVLILSELKIKQSFQKVLTISETHVICTHLDMKNALKI